MLWGEHPDNTLATTSINEKTLVFEERSFSIPEHSEVGSSIGFLKMSDSVASSVIYSLESEEDIEIDRETGELKVGAHLNLDYEHTDKIPFSAYAFDGKIHTRKTYELQIEDVDETEFLTAEEKELINYFQFLSLWKGHNHRPKTTNRKWEETMKLHLGGTITDTFRTKVERVIDQYNVLMTLGDFRITLTEDAQDANAHLYFGPKEEVKTIWPDMYSIIKGGKYDGFAKTPSKNNVLSGTRIWLSNPLEALLKHELGHALGLGHSDKCEDEKSFLCSKIGSKNDILPIEENVIRYLYHSDMPAGLSETEIEMAMANLIVSER